MSCPRLLKKPWKELERQKVFEKFGRGIDRVIFELPDGSKKEYYVKIEKPSVAIFAVTNNDEVILVEQFRPGPKKIIRELPGGYLDNDERPIDAAKRELLEETGYIGSFQYMFAFNDCAYSTRVKHCFLATNCERSTSSISGAEGRVLFMPIASFKQRVLKEPMTDVACAIAALTNLALAPKKPKKSRS